MKKPVVLMLSGVLACALALPALAAEMTAVPISAPVAEEMPAALPDSLLYYGTVQEIVKDETGAITQLRLSSERYGEYVMNIGPQTVWVDSGRCTVSDPATLAEGECVYVFHSTIATCSLPPQSPAFAVVRNIPMDVGCAQYHEVEAVTWEDGTLRITTDNGGLYLLADDETQVSVYGLDEAGSLDDILVGGYVMAWYGPYAASYPGQAHANHLMVLPIEGLGSETEDPETPAATETMTRGELVSLLHQRAGAPVVDFAMTYSDVDQETADAEAIRWATSEGLVSGYDNGAFGPNDPLTREQLATILWHYAGSPMLMDYTGLTAFADAADISDYAQPALAWAHQKGYVTAQADHSLSPQGQVSQAEAQAFLDALAEH